MKCLKRGILLVEEDDFRGCRLNHCSKEMPLIPLSHDVSLSGSYIN